MVWYGVVWYGVVWCGMVWYGMVWYGMETKVETTTKSRGTKKAELDSTLKKIENANPGCNYIVGFHLEGIVSLRR